MLRLSLPGASGQGAHPQRALLGVTALLFASATALTITWCVSMAAMGGMPMPGDWTLSMAWMRMPGQTWPDATMRFLGMWVVMMVAMMLPSLLPMLWRYRIALSRVCAACPARLTALAGVAYFAVWTAVGLAVYPLGMTLAATEMQQSALARAVPILTAAVVAAAGAFQFSRWKSHHLACCRASPACGPVSADVVSAWRLGLRAGQDCVACCANLTAILLIGGVMDLRAMAVVTTAITLERLAPNGERVARAVGVVMVVAGLFLAARAAGLG